MNQILYTIEGEKEKNRTRGIISFFAVAIMIFGFLITSMGGYNIVLAKREKDAKIEAEKIPNVELASEDNFAIISVNHIREVKNIIYSWNDEEENVLAENTSVDIRESIEIPAGNNTLNVKVVDVQGKIATASKEFAYEGIYTDLSVIDSKSIKITVTDVTGLQSVTYKWNSGEETVAYPDPTNQQVIEIITDIPTGLNTISVSAVNKQNKVENKELAVKGITKPAIKINYNVDKTLISLTLNDDQGIESYSYTISTAPISAIAKNGEIIPDFKSKLNVVSTQDKVANGELSISEKFTFNEGFNYLEITVRNIEGVEEKFSGWCAK